MEVKQCKSCGASIIWMRTSKGKMIPIDAETVRPGDETTGGVLAATGSALAATGGALAVYMPGIHVSHFATCPHAKQWRKTTPAPVQRGIEELAAALSKRK